MSVELSRHREWMSNTSLQFRKRREWLKSWPFSLFGCASAYEAYSRAVADAFLVKPTDHKSEDLLTTSLGEYWGWKAWLSRVSIGALMRLGFVVIAFWPLWLLSAIVGYFVIRRRMIPKPEFDLMGICDRHVTPFYSGLYAPLIPNKGKYSGTDLACPGLACPEMSSRQSASNHRCARLLRKFRAFNETNLSLIRVILAHADFPAIVPEEQAADRHAESSGDYPSDDNKIVNFVTNEGMSIEKSAKDGLLAILDAHRQLSRYFQHLRTKGLDPDSINQHYDKYLAGISKLGESIGPLGKTLMLALTSARAEAISKLGPEMVATAYLAIEAGKALVFQRKGDRFSTISRFPHLQARAVLHSITSYTKDYDGDERLLIRQAVICSRRHGDFGRAFLPYRMPIESRALRDWLEVLFSHPTQHEDTSKLVELDAHMEEIHTSWRKEFAKRVQGISSGRKKGRVVYAKGIVYKSVVLVPLREVVEVGLSNIGGKLAEHITDLLSATRAYQTTISISARLPGMKRLAVEASHSGLESGVRAERLAAGKNGKALLKDWAIMRRMLTRYNWLSTRVGDDSVPIDGLVHGLVRDAEKDGNPIDSELDMLVPLRQRRFREILGKRWEKKYYEDTPDHNDVKVYVDFEAFDEARKGRSSEDAPQESRNGSSSACA